MTIQDWSANIRPMRLLILMGALVLGACAPRMVCRDVNKMGRWIEVCESRPRCRDLASGRFTRCPK